MARSTILATHGPMGIAPYRLQAAGVSCALGWPSAPDRRSPRNRAMLALTRLKSLPLRTGPAGGRTERLVKVHIAQSDALNARRAGRNDAVPITDVW